MSTLTPTIDQLIRSYFYARLSEVVGIKQRRIALLEPHLRRCLEAEAERLIAPSRRTLFNAEKEFDPLGAFARTATADELIAGFAAYVQPPWLREHPIERQEQLDAVVAMSAVLIGAKLVDTSATQAAIVELENAVDAARRGLAAERREAKRSRRLAKIATAEREAMQLAEWMTPGVGLPAGSPVPKEWRDPTRPIE